MKKYVDLTKYNLYSFGILLKPLVTHFQSDNSTISWVGSLYCGMYMSSGPIVGGLVSKKMQMINSDSP